MRSNSIVGAMVMTALMLWSGVANADAYDVHLVTVCADAGSGAGSGHLHGDFMFLDGGANTVDHVTGTISFRTQGTVVSAGIERVADAGTDAGVIAATQPSSDVLGVDMFLYGEQDNEDLENGRMFVQINTDLCPDGELRGTFIQVNDGLDASSFPPPDASGSSTTSNDSDGGTTNAMTTSGGCATSATPLELGGVLAISVVVSRASSCESVRSARTLKATPPQILSPRQSRRERQSLQEVALVGGNRFHSVACEAVDRAPQVFRVRMHIPLRHVQ